MAAQRTGFSPNIAVSIIFMNGHCKLCGIPSELRESHYVPRFVIQWLKKTGGGYFRQAVAPNKRLQDGPKAHLLCEECEQRFSVREAYFAKTVFRPIVEGQATGLDYDSRLFYFLVSLLWRSAIGTLEINDFATHRFHDLLARAEEDWRRYLLGRVDMPVFSDIHLFISDITTGPVMPVKRFNTYLTRAIDMTLGCSETRCFVYAKFGRFLIFGHLTQPKDEDWIRTRIHPQGGKLEFPQLINDGQAGDFIVSRADESNKNYDSRVSEKTKKSIADHYARELPNLLGSDLMRAQAADFGQTVIKPSARGSGKLGRNDPCPCGSGKKFKHCHGGPNPPQGEPMH